MKLVERITVVQSNGATQTIYKKKKKKRKVSAWARPLERAERAILEAQATFFAEAKDPRTREFRSQIL